MSLRPASKSSVIASESPARSSIASISTSKFPPSSIATSLAPEPKKPPPRSAIASQRAREKQHTRFHSDRKVNCNARMGPRQIKQHCKLSDESQELIRVAMTELNLSARAYDRILKVSRTVADLPPTTTSPPNTSAKRSNTAPSIERSGFDQPRSNRQVRFHALKAG